MKVLLACSAGMSTSMLVQKMERYIKEQGLSDEVTATSATEAKEILKDYDVLLIAPQVRFEEKSFIRIATPLNIPVGLIDVKLYGTLNGEEVFKEAQKLYRTVH
jgi:PTS system cellobiose-specific IIB component